MEPTFHTGLDSEISFDEKVKYWAKNLILPKGFLDFSLDNLMDSDEKTVLKAYDEGSDDFGFLLLGKSGVGKTYALCAFLNKILAACHKFHVRMSGWVTYYPVGLLLYKLRSQREAKEFNDCISARFLFLDDLGAENTTDFAREHFFTILDLRCQQKRPTFISSNLTLKELQDKYGERLVSRLKEMCAILTLPGNDKRTDIMKDRIQELKLRMSKQFIERISPDGSSADI